MLKTLREQERTATSHEREVLAQWRSWGALPQIFDEQDTPRAVELRSLLTDAEWASARRTTINAHYTDPAIVRQVWRAVEGLGFDGGRVLEPGCGSGLFIAEAPSQVSTRFTGVELDPVSADIARYLHPEATIRAESYAATPFPDSSFDLTIGNVPFADVALYDPTHNAGKHSLHNHFILKSLALTRPGGLVAVLTSRYTMDSASQKARREMYDRADLVGAVRLPTGAHREFAGTDAVTDLLILRRRPEGEPRRDDAWLASSTDSDLGVPLNDYWTSHPDNVIGDMRVEEHGMYGRTDLRVRLPEGVSPRSVPAQLAARVDDITRTAHAEGLTITGPKVIDGPTIEPVARLGDPRTFRGHITHVDGIWHRLTGHGQTETFDVPRAAAPELRSLIDLRDSVLTVLDLEAAAPDDTPDLVRARELLRSQHETHLRTYGPINRVRVTQTSRLDSDGNPILSRTYPTASRLFRSDPHAPVVKALENYDETTNTATQAAILTRRVLTPTTTTTRADSPADALAITLDTVGRADLEHIAGLLDTTPDNARAQLGTLVYNEPGTGRLVPAPEYLSGNVRQALAAASAAAQDDPRYQVNVDALTRVLPPDLDTTQIKANLGAVWIPASDYQHFIRDTLNDAAARVEHLGGVNWKIRNGLTRSPAATVTWGTDRLPAHNILEKVMRQERIVVMDRGWDHEGRETQVVNVVATEAAAAKAELLQQRFDQWIWQDPERAQRLTRTYNDTFNAIVLRSYDAEGERLSLPGLAVSFNPHPHQRAAVARMIGEPAVGLFHAVGAGKTAEMVMGTTELKRLGLVNKPAVVVPNHMLEQVSREWLQLYPGANILAAASEDLRGEGRRDFIARAATGDWDAVILTQGAFKSIPVSLEADRAYRDRQIQPLRKHLESGRANGVSYQSIKQLEKALLRAEERLESLMDAKRDPGLTWEQTGIDYLVVDELHMYKNRDVITNIQDVAVKGSERATDLDMKIDILRQKAGPTGRVLTGATATPIANTIAEAWVMQKYLRPDLLEDAGLSDFDSWAATFGRTVSKLEMRPAGNGFRVTDRFAAFDNLPELLQMWHVPADVKTAADLALPVPELTAGPDGRRAPQIVAVPQSSAQRDFMQDLGKRSDAVQQRAVTPDIDNMLTISGDGRKAGLDLRLITQDTASPIPATAPGLFDEPSKVDVAASRIAQIWQQHRDTTYPGSDKPGALQIVFCDLGTPKADQWNVYDALRAELTERGMDPTRIRFIHDAKNDAQKGRLFAACREGDVDVIVGSTEKMGVGTNIQTRAVALHHLDCPWRPADVEQREGRILRQGNANPEVQILRYVTERSFDAYMWQGVARKAAFIDQVMHGKLDQRTAEDLDGDNEQFDYATITAIASGNPLLLERADAQADLDKLVRLEAAHRNAQSAMVRTVADLDQRIEHLETAIPRLHRAAAATTPTRGDGFSATIDGYIHTERPAAAEALRAHVDHGAERLRWGAREVSLRNVITIGGHTLHGQVERNAGSEVVTFTLPAVPAMVRLAVPRDALNGAGVITRLENLVASIPERAANAEASLVTARADRAEAQKNIGQPFPRHDELVHAQNRFDVIESKLAGKDHVAQRQTDPTPPPLDPEAREAAELASLSKGLRTPQPQTASPTIYDPAPRAHERTHTLPTRAR